MQKIDFVNSQQPALNDTNLNLMQNYIETAINAQVSGDTLPVGAIMPYASDTIPENWLLCNGQAVSRTTYSILFGIIGTTYGVGDGSTTFNLPNLKGRVAVGKDTTQTEFNSLGETGGEKTHTQTINEMPEHFHGSGLAGAGSETGYGISYTYTTEYRVYNGDDFITKTGNGQPMNNLQPYITTNYIIKATQSAGVVATVVDNLTSSSTTDALSAKQGNVLNTKFTPVVLYNDAAGTNDVVTLSDNVNNYEYVEIIFRVGQTQKTSIWKKNSSYPYCMLDFWDFSDNKLKFATKTIHLNGTSITISRYKYYTIQDSSTWTPYGSNDNAVYIICVRGYKY